LLVARYRLLSYDEDYQFKYIGVYYPIYRILTFSSAVIILERGDLLYYDCTVIMGVHFYVGI
jgi:hypothetical protein